jgi:hypothetical protein
MKIAVLKVSKERTDKYDEKSYKKVFETKKYFLNDNELSEDEYSFLASEIASGKNYEILRTEDTNTVANDKVSGIVTSTDTNIIILKCK